MAQTIYSAPFWRMDGISKHYGGVRALENVGLTVERGRIHAVLGENGAGKSTLIKIMSGVVRPDSGTMELEGKPVRFAGPADHDLMRRVDVREHDVSFDRGDELLDLGQRSEHGGHLAWVLHAQARRRSC